MATKVHKGTNYLLNKDDVGKSKPTTRDLPNQNHAYGKPDIKDPEGVAEGIRIISHPQLATAPAVQKVRTRRGLQKAQ